MSISTYAELQTALANWLDKYDLSTDMVKDLIAVGEYRLYDDIKLRAMEEAMSETLLTGAQTVTYPSDAIGFKDAVYVIDNDMRTPIVQRSEEWIKTNYPSTASTTTGSPRNFYLTNDGKLSFDKIADQDYTIVGTYYKRLTLSDTNTTNWVLTNYPMAILYAALLEAQVLIEDDPRRYEVMYEEQIRRMRRRENRERFGASKKMFSQVDIGGTTNIMGGSYVSSEVW